MKRLALASCLAVAVAACESRPDGRSPLPQPTSVAVPPEPAPPPPSASPPAGYRVIQLGERITESIGDDERRYAVASPVAGQVIARLEWLDTSGAVTLRLEVNGTEINWQCGEHSAWPVAGRVQAVAGEHVRIVVKRGPGCWDYRVAPLASEPMTFTVWADLEE
jgi:hypothetical protein